METAPSPPSISLLSNLQPESDFKSRDPSAIHSHQTLNATHSPLDSRTSSVHDYNFSGIYDESSTQSEREDLTDDEVTRAQETASSRSSISSLPGSVAPSMVEHVFNATTPTKASVNSHGRLSSLSSGIKSPKRRLEKDRDSPFRHPSSIIAMQMRDEDEMSHLRRGSNMTRRLSNFSARSSTPISPSKRNSRSLHSTPQKQKVKKEYPLVLLHCTLLPPVLPLQTKITDSMLLHEILPTEYWRRWKLLSDKVCDNGEVSARGVLIPHPQGDYDLLEERLLESLELVKPRIRSGHFLGEDLGDNKGVEQDTENLVEIEEEQADVAQQGTKCPDCGTRVLEDVDRDRKWEIKVYAANGLMRAGAWSAAWNEMEKVDVEVGVWLPEAVRRQIEETLRDVGIPAEQQPQPEPEPSERADDARRREIYGDSVQNDQDRIDGLFDDDPRANNNRFDEARQQSPGKRRHRTQTPLRQEQYTYSHPQVRQEPDLKTLLLNYIHVLSQDRRNIAIAILSVIVLFYALSTSSSPAAAQKPVAIAPVEPVSVLSPATQPGTTTTTTLQFVPPTRETVVEVLKKETPSPEPPVKVEKEVEEPERSTASASSLKKGDENAKQEMKQEAAGEVNEEWIEVME